MVWLLSFQFHCWSVLFSASLAGRMAWRLKLGTFCTCSYLEEEVLSQQQGKKTKKRKRKRTWRLIQGVPFHCPVSAGIGTISHHPRTPCRIKECRRWKIKDEKNWDVCLFLTQAANVKRVIFPVENNKRQMQNICQISLSTSLFLN